MTVDNATNAGRRVAVIGLGSMGYGMAVSLKRAGFDVVGFDVRQESVERFVAEGGMGAATPGQAAAGAAAEAAADGRAERLQAAADPRGRVRTPQGALFAQRDFSFRSTTRVTLPPLGVLGRSALGLPLVHT